MRRGTGILRVLLLCALAPAGASWAREVTMPLWLMTTAQWRAATPASRSDRVRDYMQAFCATPAMSPRVMRECIDRGVRGLPRNASLYDLANACLRAAN